MSKHYGARTALNSFAVIIFMSVVSCSFLVNNASAVVLSDITVNRSVSVLSGIGVLSSPSAGSISLSSFSPSVVDPITSLSYFPSLAFGPDSTGVLTGAVDFTSTDFSVFPPATDVFLGGAISDVSSAPGVLSFLFTDTGSSGLFVLDVSSAAILGTTFNNGLDLGIAGFAIPGFADTSATLSVFSAKSTVIPLPASGLLLLGALILTGTSIRRRRRS